MATVTDPTSPIYNTPAGGLQPTAAKPTLQPGQYYDTYNNIVTPGVATKTAPIVSTSKLANKDMANIKTTMNDAIAGMTQQQANKTTAAAQPVNTEMASWTNMPLSQRMEIAKQYGIQNYTGTTEQNQQLVAALTQKKNDLLQQAKNSGLNVDAYLASTGQIDPTQTGTNQEQNAYNQGIIKDFNNVQDNLLKEQDKIDQENLKYQSDLANLRNGTFPLTPDQQAIIDATIKNFETLRQQQIVANQNYEGAITTAGIVSGRQRYAPEIQSGEKMAAVAAGIQKLADLDSQQSMAIAKLREGFKKDNLDLIKAAHEDYQNSVKRRMDTIKSIYDASAAILKDQRDFQYKQAQDAIKNQLESDKFDAQKANDAIENAYKNAQITKVQAETYKAQLEARQLKQQLEAPGTGTTAPVVQMTANNKPSVAGQKAYLQSLPGGENGDLATLIKGIANYQINLSVSPQKNYRGTSGLTQEQLAKYVLQYDPTFVASEFANRQALRKNFTSGKYSQNINALNTAVGHISDIVENTKELNNIGFVPYNIAKNVVLKTTGAGGLVRAGMNIQAATAELATVFKGTGATDQEIHNLGTINEDSSPEQIKAYVETATQLLASRLQALEDTYTSGMGKAPDKTFLSPSSQNILLKLQGEGVNIKVPQLAESPVLKLQAFHDSGPQYAELLDKLIAADPSLGKDPQAMLDTLAQNGIEL